MDAPRIEEVLLIVAELLDAVESNCNAVGTVDTQGKRLLEGSSADDRKRMRRSSGDDDSELVVDETSTPDSTDKAGSIAEEGQRSENASRWRTPVNVLQDLRNWQTGLKTPLQHAHQFVSSISLVKRFQLSSDLQFHFGCVNCLNFNRSGSLLASGSDDQKVCIWDWMRSRPATWFDSGHRSNVFQTKFIPFTSDRLIATSGRDGYVRLSELDSSGRFRRSKHIMKHSGPCHKIVVSPDNPKSVVSCGEDGSIKHADLRMNDSWRLLNVTSDRGRRVPLYSISVRPWRSNEFVTCGMDEWLRIYDFRFTRPSHNGSFVKRFCPHRLEQCNLIRRRGTRHVTSAVYSPNGREIVASYHNDNIYLFDAEHSDMADCIHVYRGHRNFDTIKGVNFYGHGGEYIISGSDCGHIFIWDKESEQIVWYDDGDEGGVVNVLEPHPTFPIIATSGYDSSVKIWEPTRPQAVSLENLRNLVRENIRARQIGGQFEMLIRIVRPVGRLFFSHERFLWTSSPSSEEEESPSDEPEEELEITEDDTDNEEAENWSVNQQTDDNTDEQPTDYESNEDDEDNPEMSAEFEC